MVSLINRILHEIELNVNIWIVKTSVLRKKQNLYQVFISSLKYDNLDYYHNLIHENRSNHNFVYHILRLPCFS